MSFFPTSIKMDNMRVLMVGGGKIVTEQVEKLVDFSSDITIIAIDDTKILIKPSNLY